MKLIGMIVLVLLLTSIQSYAETACPVSFYQSFDTFDFLDEDFVHETGVLGDSELLIPFTKRYGVPKYFQSDVLIRYTFKSPNRIFFVTPCHS